MDAKIIVLIAAAFLLLGCTQPESEKPVLTIYTYDSMVGEYGLGPVVVPRFEEQCNCEVKMLAKGDAGQVLTTLILEKDFPKADIAIGIDDSMLPQALRADVLEQFTPNNIGVVPEELRFGKGYLTPYDYGYFAFMYDNEKVDADFSSFDGLLDSSLRDSVAIQNPRTSSPGLGLLLWSIAVYGDPGYKDFWREFRPNILAVTDSWDESAGLFAAGEAPVYHTYATSPPYYASEGKTNLVGAIFREGHYVQIEGMGIVKGAKNRALAEQFIEFSLTEGFQKEIPTNQYMFPANSQVAMPEEFELYAVKPSKTLSLDPELVEEKQEEWILEWEKIMVSG
ncbi:MAG: thiamine ABC transporter substrate-binding protein [archaeon]|nr:thiamine ABC transporter substrate-binding protein [archaeon]